MPKHVHTPGPFNLDLTVNSRRYKCSSAVVKSAVLLTMTVHKTVMMITRMLPSQALHGIDTNSRHYVSVQNSLQYRIVCSTE